jgi:hypothetical protein
MSGHPGNRAAFRAGEAAGVRDRTGDPVDFARGHIARVYANVLDRLTVVRLSADPAADIAAAGLASGAVEHATRQGFAFWNPDGSKCATKSTPSAHAVELMAPIRHLPQHPSPRARKGRRRNK